ncbi:PfkB family carbohydrate kinase [Tessaracoccus palaemonis]|uniref:Carbohydrate kinase PfkB domain-containing protein n=1 Tax=Tessaracoccus palaemonis TaxID=2829499 RepID=A0ABX8SHU3_9ACTN|nr:PfkB family carbohydrate kinase [Tessaracoccus palaemonis]QXT62870.1 hypothetical protein KDB89_14270 [Tessaracoccus palaemonis]
MSAVGHHESLLDIIHRADSPTTEHPGGSPANVAYGLARLEHPVWLLTELADDPAGRLIATHLAAPGVELIVSPA